MSMQRRDFLSRSLAAIATTTVAGATVGRAAESPNEKVNVAVLGSGRGANLAQWFSKLPESQLVAVCDVDANRSGPLCDRIAELSGRRPEAVVDYRRLLDRSDIDAIAIATPDHWHAPITIQACLAGKDVYVEKPCSHNISEGRLAVKAARKYGRIVQHGTILRGTPHYQEAWKLLREGVIGKLLMVKSINNQKRGRVEVRPDGPVPPGVDYDLWLGPAKKRPFNPNHFHSAWHWMWDYGTGDLGNDGVHQIDLGRWGAGLGIPKAVSCSGAKLASRGDAQETPDTMVVTWEYEDLLYVYEQRDFSPYRMQGHRKDNDNIFFGETGYMMIDRDGYRVFFKDETGPSFKQPWTDTPVYFQNFIDAIKSRRHEDLLADIEEGHQSSLLCHLGNIAYRTGRRLEFDPQTETFPHDAEANQLLTREYRKGFELPSIS
ncbi:MAG: Gfo/Idh/MocA family oxidoreductase [Planctomycetota bacterium]|nr:Gfo/Idh/MocA family oxidoreductase [Planctomycetota bacterium]